MMKQKRNLSKNGKARERMGVCTARSKTSVQRPERRGGETLRNIQGHENQKKCKRGNGIGTPGKKKRIYWCSRKEIENSRRWRYVDRREVVLILRYLNKSVKEVRGDEANERGEPEGRKRKVSVVLKGSPSYEPQGVLVKRD